MTPSTENLSIELDGVTYTGRRSVTGTRKLSQTVHYGDASKDDPHTYASNEDATMRSVARSLLRELVQEVQSGTH
jgi:hypothetical protein